MITVPKLIFTSGLMPSRKMRIELLREEFIDRFGELPEPLVNLLKIAAIKLVATAGKVSSIVQEKELIKIAMEEKHGLSGSQLMELARRYRRQVSFNASKGLEILVNIQGIDRKKMLDFLEEIVVEISALVNGDKILI